MKTCLARLGFREQCLFTDYQTVLAVHPNHFIVKNVPNHIGAQRFKNIQRSIFSEFKES